MNVVMDRRRLTAFAVALIALLVCAPAATSASEPSLLQAESLRGGAALGAHARTVAAGRTARGTWRTGAAGTVSVRARAPRCAAAPTLAVTVDGRRAARLSVRGGGWHVVRAAVALRPGRHAVALSVRPGRKRCARRVDVDWVRATAKHTSAAAPAAPAAARPASSATSAPGTMTTTASTTAGAQALYVDPDSPARHQADAWRATRPADAATMDRLAARPQAVWLGEWSGDVARAAEGVTTAAAVANALPVLVAYAIPQRDCGGWSAGGVTPDGYRAWIRRLAAGIASRPALVILEPDALAGMDCLSTADRATRLALLRDAVSVLAAQPRTRVYLDAGNAGWHPAADIAARLRDAGVAGAAGFALNVSNFGTDDSQIAYGRAIAAAAGGKPFVVDTSRNGNGPLAGQWCNPSGRAVGRAPTLATGVAGVDAFLWVKRPGESDGACNGGPSAGTWWPDEALGLARRGGL
jgi:endoglucanase